MRKNLIDPKVLNKMPAMSKEEALAYAVGIFEHENFSSKPEAQARLIRDVNEARTSTDICGIMYRVMLAGEGHRTVNSAWKRRYG